MLLCHIFVTRTAKTHSQRAGPFESRVSCAACTHLTSSDPAGSSAWHAAKQPALSSAHCSLLSWISRGSLLELAAPYGAIARVCAKAHRIHKVVMREHPDVKATTPVVDAPRAVGWSSTLFSLAASPFIYAAGIPGRVRVIRRIRPSKAPQVTIWAHCSCPASPKRVPTSHQVPMLVLSCSVLGASGLQEVRRGR